MLWTAEMDTYITVNRGALSAELMGRFLKVTRSAVIGRSHRLRLPTLSRSPTGKPKERVEYYRPKVGMAIKICEPPAMPVAPLNIPFIDLNSHHCREIVGSEGVGQSLSCGHPIAKESYCRFHYAQNYFRPRR